MTDFFRVLLRILKHGFRFVRRPFGIDNTQGSKRILAAAHFVMETDRPAINWSHVHELPRFWLPGTYALY